MAILTSNSARRAGRVARLGLLLAALVGAAPIARPASAPAAEAPVTEYQLKAAFVFNFTQFVEWPREVFPSPTSPLVIGILGDDPFGSYLDRLIAGERVQGHPLVARRFATVDEALGSHVLFFGRSESNRLGTIFAVLKGRPILTVGEVDGFAVGGGMIRFLAGTNNRIRLRINLESARTAGLTISSKLLRAAEIVVTETPAQDTP